MDVRHQRDKWNAKRNLLWRPAYPRGCIAERLSHEDSADDKKKKIDLRKIPKEEYKHLIRDLTSQMNLASANLEFEKAAELRDLIAEVKSKLWKTLYFYLKKLVDKA